MAEHELDESVHTRICELCKHGDTLVNEAKYPEAFACYSKALQLVPEPAENWEATTWILAAIGDLYFIVGKHHKSMRAFQDALKCPGGLGNAFIRLRLGQCYFELYELDLAANQLTFAYMSGGREVFDREDPKYLTFLSSRIKPPVGQIRL